MRPFGLCEISGLCWKMSVLRIATNLSLLKNQCFLKRIFGNRSWLLVSPFFIQERPLSYGLCLVVAISSILGVFFEFSSRNKCLYLTKQTSLQDLAGFILSNRRLASIVMIYDAQEDQNYF
jgi:hypothetical protein